MTLSIKIKNATLSMMTFSTGTVTLSITTSSTMTFSTMTFSTMTFSIMTLETVILIVIYAECHLCLVSFILSVTKKLNMLSVILLNAVMLNVVAP